MDDFFFGFRIVGDCHRERRLVHWRAAFAGYAECDQRAEVNSEAYLSAFTFSDEFRHRLELSGTTKGYAGPCFAPWLWVDIDRDGDLEAATHDARRLCATAVERYGVDGDALLIFFSGSKGYHVGLPSALWAAEPGIDFHRVARHFAEQLSAAAGVAIDTAVYDRVRAFRAPNSRHPKTGLHKRRLEFDELLLVTTAAILDRAAKSEPFDLPVVPPTSDAALADWQRAVEAVRERESAVRQRYADGSAKLNRQTLDFIRDGANVGDRHRLLFSAAANLAEFGCPPALAHALLTEPALDCGLSPSEVRRQIDCGLSHHTATDEQGAA
jgi:hypothetical protein